MCPGTVNFLQYCAIKNGFDVQWKRLLKDNNQGDPTVDSVLALLRTTKIRAQAYSFDQNSEEVDIRVW